ncbi:hypothetical protein [Cupriavidus sp. IDO]|uniref:hypothetical protein n=1 Tax=Cupriavidus sp. IDO TaxID=1539142 RepID=UPI00057921CA|nr:hypothetical protein [Cupriavidus sp. IDO]KWR85760.1 hypothetical protein RM96_27435 [Cupriavidus sp. IDO]
MSERLRWTTVEYRDMYVHAITFVLSELGRTESPSVQKWGYVVAIHHSADRDVDFEYGPSTNRTDYFTREAAEQAALHYGKQAIDIILEPN